MSPSGPDWTSEVSPGVPPRPDPPESPWESPSSPSTSCGSSSVGSMLSSLSEKMVPTLESVPSELKLLPQVPLVECQLSKLRLSMATSPLALQDKDGSAEFQLSEVEPPLDLLFLLHQGCPIGIVMVHPDTITRSR